MLPVDEELRNTVHREITPIKPIRTSSGSMRPRDIQALLRAGVSAEKVAEESEMSIDQIHHYETPILSERAWVVSQAQACQIGKDPDSPTLEELVVDRLAALGIGPNLLTWDAIRGASGPWRIELFYVQDARQKQASWDFDNSTSTLRAVNDDARWLTETSTAPAFSPLIPTSKAPAPESVAAPSAGDQAATEALLDDLSAARGSRLAPALDAGDDDIAAMEAAIAAGFVDFGETTESSTPPDGVYLSSSAEAKEPEDEDEEAEKPASIVALPYRADTAEPVLPGMENLGGDGDNDPKPTPRRRSRRQSVPSWDDIMLGKKNS